MPSNGDSLSGVPSSNNANPQSVNTVTGEKYPWSVLGAASDKGNTPGYAYKYASATSGTPGTENVSSSGATSNGIVFGQRYANPVMGFSGETENGNVVVQTLRYGALLPEAVVAFRAANGGNVTGQQKKKPRYIKNFFR